MTGMEKVEEAVNDLDIIGGELSWLTSDLRAFLEGRNLKPSERQRLLSIAQAADLLRLRLVGWRTRHGLRERPE